jgi:hydroxybutyrate-dimer hydrolase
MSVYAACAAHAPGAAGTVLFGPQAAGISRCTSLREKGLVEGDTLVDQANSAREKLRAHGYAAPQDWGIASHDTLGLWRSLQVTYANAHGRFAVQDNLCGMSFAGTDALGRPAPLAADAAARLFADSSGVPPTGGVNVIADAAANGPIIEAAAVSRSTGRADLNLDGALCFRALQTGQGLDGAGWADFARVQLGTRQVQTTGRLRGTPAIIIHGRQDALVFPNLHSRAYYALNQEQERRKSRLSYIEVTTGQHFDAFISSLFFGPAGVQFAPLHYYFVQAMDNMYAHLTSGAALLPSQVVRPTPRGVQPYSAANVPVLLPPASAAPAAADRIVFDHGQLLIPE